jgi:hypothetical protein
MARRALRLEHAPTDVRREVDATRLISRAFDSKWRSCIGRRLRRADRWVERGAENERGDDAAHAPL